MVRSPVSRRAVAAWLCALPAAVAVLTVPTVLAAAPQEPQPHMRAALAALQAAKRHLDQATADKGGHRVKAIGHTNAALAEVQLGIDADNRR